MYRRYENPYKIEQRLNALKTEYDKLKEVTDEEALVDLHCEIEDLEERLNFAWQDDEYDSEY